MRHLLLLLVAGSAFAQGYPRPSHLVTVQTPDGGLPVVVTGTPTVQLGLPDGGVQVLQVEGRSGQPVDVTGSTVTLSSSSLSALTAPNCDYGPPQVIAALSTTPTAIPAVPFATRTELRIVNLSTTHEVWCLKDPGDGGVPTATLAYVLRPNGGEISLPVRASDTVRCRSALATSRINIMESACEQP